MQARGILPAVTILLTLCNANCAQAAPRQQPPDDPIERWLECGECNRGELAAVIRLGPTGIVRLSTALRAGPAQQKQIGLRRELGETYRTQVNYARMHPEAPMPVTEQQYVDQHLGKYVLLYQSRAARALAALNTPESKKALTDAQALPLPAELQRVIQESLASMR
jgi:hypothetical protein